MENKNTYQKPVGWVTGLFLISIIVRYLIFPSFLNTKSEPQLKVVPESVYTHEEKAKIDITNIEEEITETDTTKISEIIDSMAKDPRARGVNKEDLKTLLANYEYNMKAALIMLPSVIDDIRKQREVKEQLGVEK